jgi:hypothetical protein
MRRLNLLILDAHKRRQRSRPPAASPLWEATGAEHDPSADPVPQPAFEFDQRLTW